MITPGDEDRPFVSRWNTLIGSLIVEPSIKLVARTAVDYAIKDGEGVYPGNERLARQTGLDERTVRQAWKFLRAEGLARRVADSTWRGDKRTADNYRLEIPERWRDLPILGPHAGRFSCQQCGRLFNPRPGWVIGKDCLVRWSVPGMTFCPDGTRGSRKGESCFFDWSLERHEAGATTWNDLGDDVWKMFRQARHDDWA